MAEVCDLYALAAFVAARLIRCNNLGHSMLCFVCPSCILPARSNYLAAGSGLHGNTQQRPSLQLKAELAQVHEGRSPKATT